MHSFIHSYLASTSDKSSSHHHHHHHHQRYHHHTFKLDLLSWKCIHGATPARSSRVLFSTPRKPRKEQKSLYYDVVSCQLTYIIYASRTSLPNDVCDADDVASHTLTTDTPLILVFPVLFNGFLEHQSI